MRTWLRLTLITLTVGGGFTGVVVTLQSLFASLGQGYLNSLLTFIGSALYAFVFVSGLIFVQNQNRTRPLSVALAIQVPWISSPFLTYKFAAGSQLALSVGNIEDGKVGFHIGTDSFLGCTFTLNLLQENRWIIGVNVVALTAFVLLWRAIQTPVPTVQTSGGAPVQPSPVEIPTHS
jgi:general stress protein CsbA